MKLIDILKEIQWLEKSYELAVNYYFPFTPAIANILNQEKTITSFHITSFEKLPQLKSLEGTKKTISTMTIARSRRLYKDLKAHWNDGVLCYLEGNLIIESKVDIVSIPDDTGRRWIEFGAVGSAIMSGGLSQEFKNFINNNMGSLMNEISKANQEKNYSKEMNNKRNIFLKTYLNLSNKFAQTHSQKILTQMYGDYLHPDEFSDTNELLVNKIKLLDCVYDDQATPQELDIINQTFPGKKIPVRVGTDEAVEIVTKFIKDRGGIMPEDELSSLKGRRFYTEFDDEY
jgi:hypothetical protein